MSIGGDVAVWRGVAKYLGTSFRAASGCYPWPWLQLGALDGCSAHSCGGTLTAPGAP